jgi:hypothetical protein
MIPGGLHLSLSLYSQQVTIAKHPEAVTEGEESQDETD